MNKIALSVLVIVLCSACAPFQRMVDRQVVAEPDPVSLRLATAADRASAALSTLASVEQTRTPMASIVAVPDAPQELRRTVTIDWNGPLEPVVRQLADRAGYSFSIIGDMPPVPVVVSVKAYQRPLVDVLRDVGLQAGQRANIVVDADRHVVEVNYAPISGG